jgi:excisionase family DNA binding protein
MECNPAVSQQLRFLTLEETARYLRRSKSWLYKAVEARKVPFTKIGNRIVFDLSSLHSWLEANSCKPRV